MSKLLRDGAHALRSLLKKPGFTVLATITLALGIGANSAIFSVVNRVLMRPFAFSEPNRLVVAWERCLNQGMSRMVVSPPNFADWRTQNQTFQDMAAYRPQDFNLIDKGEPERVRGLRVSATMFSMLGIRPILGRDFEPDEDKPGTPNSVIISHGFWQRRFGGANVIGQSLTLGNESATIIGVMPPDFDFPPPITFRGEARAVKVELWTQLRYLSEQQNQRNSHNLFVLARLKPGVSLASAEADLQNITRRLAHDFADTNSGWDAFLVPLNQQVIGDVRTALQILPAAVLFVLLIACANVANLLLVRSTRRRRGFAIRIALGASRWRVVYQVMLESALLSLLGGVVGLGLAAVLLKLVAALAPQNIYRLQEASLDGRVVLFTMLVSLITALVFGAVPAWQASRVNLLTSLKDGNTSATDGAVRHRSRNLLVVAEVGLALLLLIGAGLLVRSFMNLQAIPTGYRPENLTAMTINLPRLSYPDREQRLAFMERLLPKLAMSPIVQSVAFGTALPLDAGLQGTEFKVDGQPVAPGHEPHTYVSLVSAGYFHTMGTPLLRGREFSASDNANAPGVVIINSYLAERFFPNEDPIGRQVDMGFRSGTLLQIVGVAADERPDSLQADLHPMMYLAYAQSPNALPMILLFRSSTEPAALTAAVRQRVHELDPQLPIYDVKTMNQVLDTATSRPRFLTALVVVFAVVAMLLAAVGIYGVISYTVAQSTREIGIRMALGAERHHVMKLVVGRGMITILLGIVLGMTGAIAVTRVMKSLLFEVSTTDPLTFLGVAVALTVVAFAACYIPARRATKVDPLVALRYE